MPTTKTGSKTIPRTIPGFKIDLPKEWKKEMMKNVKDVLDSGMLAAGKYVKACEEKIQEISGSSNVFAVTSGSVALEACAYALRKEHGTGGSSGLNMCSKRVLVPANTFIATSRAFERQGFEVEFYQNGIPSLYSEELLKRLSKDSLGYQYVGLVIVDIGGFIPKNIKEIVDEAHKNGLWVCEDACQAFGSEYIDKGMAGTFGDIGAYSFYATKVVAGGEGGAVVTESPVYAHHVEMYRNFGKASPWVSYHYADGWNGRMNELSAAVLLTQLEHYEEIKDNRFWIMREYQTSLSSNPNIGLLNMGGTGVIPNGYKVIAYINEGVPMDKFIELCKEDGVKFQGAVYEWTLDQQPVYLDKPKLCKFDRDWVLGLKRMICLPTWYGMTDEDIGYVVVIILKNLDKVLEKDL